MPDYYFNEGAALEKANQYEDAVRALNFYLMAAPSATDAGEVRGRIEGIKFEQQKATQQQALASIQAREAAQRKATMFAGRWYSGDGCWIEVSYSSGVYDVRDCSSSEATPVDGGGGRIMQTRTSIADRVSVTDSHLAFRLAITLHIYGGGVNRTNTQTNDYDLVISDDGQHLGGQWVDNSDSRNSGNLELYRR